MLKNKYRSNGYRETKRVGTRRLNEWVQGDQKSGYRYTIRVGTGRLLEWVHRGCKNGYRETTIRVGTVRL